MKMGSEDIGIADYGDLKMLVINVNLSKFIFFKNGLSRYV